MESFERVYLNLSDSDKSGKCRLAESGLGWKPLGEGEPFFLDIESIGQPVTWSRAAKGFELKINSKTKGTIKLDGFEAEVSPTLLT